MRIVYAGTPEFARPSLEALDDSRHDVAGVITRVDAPQGRKRVLTPSPVALEADARGIETMKTNRLDDEATAWVRGMDPDLGVIVAYGGLVRPPLLQLPRLGWVNLHFSLLPRWRGAAPVQRALMAGEDVLGVSVFRLVDALDAGDLLTQESFSVAPGTSAGAALTMLAREGTGALLRAIELLEHDPAAGTAQVGDANYAHKLLRSDGRLDPRRPRREVLAHWAGVTPEPGAHAVCEEQTINLHELRLPSDDEDAAISRLTLHPGEVALEGQLALLACADGALIIERVQPPGKAAMNAADWLRGRGKHAVFS